MAAIRVRKLSWLVINRPSLTTWGSSKNSSQRQGSNFSDLKCFLIPQTLLFTNSLHKVLSAVPCGDFYGAYRKPDGNWNWPANMGAVPGTEKVVTLPRGFTIDRFGNENGRFVSPADVSFDERSLVPGAAPDSYRKYQVEKPLPDAVQAEVAPAFGKSGGGTQILLEKNIKWYVENGYLKEIK